MLRMLLDNARDNLLSAALEYAETHELADQARASRFSSHVHDSMADALVKATARLERAARLYRYELAKSEGEK
jgi:hypothetical protein